MVLSSSYSACFGCVYAEERINGPHCLVHDCCVQYRKKACDRIHDTVRDSSLLAESKATSVSSVKPYGFVKTTIKTSVTEVREQQLKERKRKAAQERRMKRAQERLDKEDSLFTGSLFD